MGEREREAFYEGEMNKKEVSVHKNFTVLFYGWGTVGLKCGSKQVNLTPLAAGAGSETLTCFKCGSGSSSTGSLHTLT